MCTTPPAAMRMKRDNFVGNSTNTKGVPHVTPSFSNNLHLIAFRKHRPPYPSRHRFSLELKLKQVGFLSGIHCRTAQPNCNSTQTSQTSRNSRHAHLGSISVSKKEIPVATRLPKVTNVPMKQLHLMRRHTH
ncbi:hypothetical protein EMIT0111MI5_250068 [Burkholderia sp. IT-111MI5]